MINTHSCLSSEILLCHTAYTCNLVSDPCLSEILLLLSTLNHLLCLLPALARSHCTNSSFMTLTRLQHLAFAFYVQYNLFTVHYKFCRLNCHLALSITTSPDLHYLLLSHSCMFVNVLFSVYTIPSLPLAMPPLELFFMIQKGYQSSPSFLIFCYPLCTLNLVKFRCKLP